MAVTALTIVAPADASPTLAAAANDTNPCWTADARAALLLFSLAACPPEGQWHRQRFGFSTDEWFAYVGDRVDALSAIRDEIGTKLLAFYHEHGEAAYEPFRCWCHQPDVTTAIDAARNACVEA